MSLARTVLLATVFAMLVSLGACSGRGKRPLRPRDVPVITRDLPPILRNTIGAESTIRGMEPALVTGYGIVVNLNGTGSSDIPLPVRATLEQEMTRMGVGAERGQLRRITPSQMLDDPNTAVVLVQAVIPPAAPVGSTFDARVTALPGTSTTSLENGLLYSTLLYRGVVGPGQRDTQPVAEVYGPVFINPFNNGLKRATSANRLAGRILGGGVVTDPLNIAVVLDNPSHSRARAITATINTQFPRRSGDRRNTARGLNEDTIEVVIPTSFQNRTKEFVQLLRYARIDRSFREQWAERYTEAIRDRPELVGELSWCLRSLGTIATPAVQKLYTDSERIPRFAALQVGATLGDLSATPHLEAIARDGTSKERVEAIELLGTLPSAPRINRFLRDILTSDQMDIRVAAYEALSRRGDGMIRRTYIGGEFLGREWLEGRFIIDEIPIGDPMIYFTQQGQPRLVLMGDVRINTPLFASGWDGRLMLSASPSEQDVRVFYRDLTTGEIVQGDVKPTGLSLIRFMAHTTTPELPEPGLDMSYSQVIGALQQIILDNGINSTLVSEADKLMLELSRSREAQQMLERPELSAAGPIEDSPHTIAEPTGEPRIGRPPSAPEDEDDLQRRREKYIVPLGPSPRSDD